MIGTPSVLVTGGTGFIGSHLVEDLVSKGYDVTVLDNFSNRQPHLPGTRVKLVKGDIRDLKTVTDATKGASIVYHLAAVLGVEYAYQHPVEVLDVEIMGTLNVLEASRKNNVKIVVYGSSSEVYGEPASLPISEDAPTTPRSTYAVAKLTGERYCDAYRRAYGLDCVVLRYFNVYGPRQDDRFVIPRFIRAALNRVQLEVYGPGDQCRDFTFIKDAVQVSVTASQTERAKSQIFNVGTGVKTKVHDVAKLIVELTGSNSSIVSKGSDTLPRPLEAEIFNRVADISRSRKLLGYEPQVSLRDGIASTIGWTRIRS